VQDIHQVAALEIHHLQPHLREIAVEIVFLMVFMGVVGVLVLPVQMGRPDRRVLAAMEQHPLYQDLL